MVLDRIRREHEGSVDCRNCRFDAVPLILGGGEKPPQDGVGWVAADAGDTRSKTHKYNASSRCVS